MLEQAIAQKERQAAAVCMRKPELEMKGGKKTLQQVWEWKEFISYICHVSSVFAFVFWCQVENSFCSRCFAYPAECVNPRPRQFILIWIIV